MEQDKQSEVEFFDRYGVEVEEHFAESDYDRWFALTGLDQISAGSTILDAGCGAGAYGRRLAQRGHQVEGVDMSPGLVARAIRETPHPGFRAIVGDLENPQLFPARRFDAIVFGQVLHHFPDRRRVLANCALWVKPTGRLYLIEPNGAHPINRLGKQVGRVLAAWSEPMRKNVGTVNEVNLASWRVAEEVRRAGFRVEQLRYDYQDFDWDTYIRRYVTSPLMAAALRIRAMLYRACWRLLPTPYGSSAFALRALRTSAAGTAG